MKEYLQEAEEEMKRADHLIFVSLKYTRTVDILKHTIDRLIATFDNAFAGLLHKAKEQGKINHIEISPIKICDQMKHIYNDNEFVLKYVEFYLLLRKISRAKYQKSNEYRRHLTMTAHLDNRDINIDIDTINEYYKDTKAFITYLEETHLIETAK